MHGLKHSITFTKILAIDLEGTEICDWLTSKGITGVLLKYRVPTPKVGRYRESPLALQDAQRTLGLVRFRAAEWQIDPHKVGVIGLSEVSAATIEEAVKIINVVAVEVEVSLWSTDIFQNGVAETAAKHNIPIVAYVSFSSAINWLTRYQILSNRSWYAFR